MSYIPDENVSRVIGGVTLCVPPAFEDLLNSQEIADFVLLPETQAIIESLRSKSMSLDGRLSVILGEHVIMATEINSGDERWAVVEHLWQPRETILWNFPG